MQRLKLLIIHDMSIKAIKSPTFTKKVSIVIPTYNEKENIRILITNIFKFLPKAKIVVVDDSPNDDTLKQIKGLRKKSDSVVVISRKKKEGRGSAVLEGLRYAFIKHKSDFYIEMDADLSHNPSELVTMLKVSKVGRVVLGSRYIKGSKIVDWPIERRIASKISNFLVKAILHNPLHDNTNGYRVYPREAVRYVLNKKFISKGYIVLSEMSYMLAKMNYEFLEIPTVFCNRKKGRSSANIKEFLRSFRDLIRIRFAH